MESPASRRPDRRRLRTRTALLHAGRALLAVRDIDAISIDEIVAAADVAKGSFYNHFADKEESFAREIGAAVRTEAERLASGRQHRCHRSSRARGPRPVRVPALCDRAPRQRQGALAAEPRIDHGRCAHQPQSAR